MTVSDELIPESVEKTTKEEDKKVKFFRVVNTPDGQKYDLNIPSIGSFRMNLIELIIFILILKRILRI